MKKLITSLLGAMLLQCSPAYANQLSSDYKVEYCATIMQASIDSMLLRADGYTKAQVKQAVKNAGINPNGKAFFDLNSVIDRAYSRKMYTNPETQKNSVLDFAESEFKICMNKVNAKEYYL